MNEFRYLLGFTEYHFPIIRIGPLATWFSWAMWTAFNGVKIDYFLVLLIVFFLLYGGEFLSIRAKLYFVKYTLLQHDNIPESMFLDLKHLFNHDAHYAYNPFKGYNTKMLKMWINLGHYKLKHNKYDFKFDISYLGKVWFDKNFIPLNSPEGQKILEERINQLSGKKRTTNEKYDLLEKYEL